MGTLPRPNLLSAFCLTRISTPSSAVSRGSLFTYAAFYHVHPVSSSERCTNLNPVQQSRRTSHQKYSDAFRKTFRPQLVVFDGGLDFDHFLSALPSKSERTRNCLGQDEGGFWHTPSDLTKAQTLGKEWLAQMSGFVCRQPSVCVAKSFGFKGA